MMYLHSHCLVSCLFASIAISGVISKQPLYLLSYTNSEDSIVNPFESSSLTIAAQLAVNHINNNSDLLSGYELRLISQDSGCIALNYVSLFRHFIYSHKNITGILGPGCSEPSITLGSEIITMPMLQTLSVGISATQTLEQQHFVNSFSTLDSTRLIVKALLKIISDNNWTRLFIAFDSTTNYYTKIFEQLNSSLPRTDFKLQYIALHNSTLEFDPVGAAPDCVENPRIFIVIAGSEIVKRIVCLFDKNFMGILYPTYQFVVVGQTLESLVTDVTFELVTFINDTVRTHAVFECSSDDIETRLIGSIFLLYNVVANTTNTLSGLSHSQFVEEYNRNIQTYNNENSNNLLPSFYGAPFYDSVWALALALNRSATDLGGNGLSDLSDYNYGDKNSTEIIRNHLLSVDFPGISGRIRFSRNNTFVPRVVDIFQVRNNKLILLEYYMYNVTEDDVTEDGLFAYGNETITDYIGDTFKLVTEKPLYTGVVLMVTIVLISILLIGFQLLSVVYVKHPSIRATSPRVYHLTYIACYILLSACVLKIVAFSFNLPEYSLKSECRIDQLAEFLFGTSDVLLYATLAAISFRIYRIFVHYMNPGKFIQNSYLISFIAIITLLYIVCDAVTIALTIEDPRIDCSNITGSVMTVDIICNVQFEWYRLPNVAFPIVPSVLACVFSLLGSKKVSINKFKTTSFALLCFIAYLNVATLTLFYLTNATSPTPALVIGSKLALVICCILLLYLPPSWPIFKEWYTGSRLEQYYVSTRSCQETDIKPKITITLAAENKLNEVNSSTI